MNSSVPKSLRILALASTLLSAPAAQYAFAAAVEPGRSQSGNYLAGLIAGEDRDEAAAAILYREALRADPKNLDLVERAFAAALASGDMREAFPLAERVLQREPTNSLARLSLAVKAFGEGQYALARTHLSLGQAGRAHDVTTTMLSAWALAGQKDLRDALSTLDRMQDGSILAFRNYHAGLIASVMGAAGDSEKRLQQAFRAQTSTLRFADAYARALARRNARSDADTVLNEFAKSVPHHALVEANRAMIDSGKPIDQLVHDAKEGAAETLYGLGAAGGRQGDELAQVVYLRLALHLRPDLDVAAMGLAEVFEQLHQLDASLEAYALVPSTSALRPTAEIQAALTLDASERADEARRRLKIIVDANSKNFEAWTALGSIQRAAKQFPEAIESYDKAIAGIEKPDRSNWTLFYFRAICFERSHDWPKAEADFKKALELFPEQPLVLNYLGYSWVDQGINLDDAFKMLRRAVELRPTDGYIVDSLGWAHYKLGHYDESLRILEKAIEMKPADPTVNDHLGDVYWRVNRRTEAHFQWNHARDNDPDKDDLPMILKKIDKGLPDEKSGENKAGEAAPVKNGG